MNEKYLNSTAEDYVIETHVNSGWAYKKWFAGESEAWGSFTIKPTYTSIEGSVRYYNVSVTLPKGVFISTPVVIATPKFNWIGGFVPSKSVSKDYITGYIWAFEERALLNENIEIYFLVKGTWK